MTGGLGFIGSEFVRQAARNERYSEIIVLDLQTYASNLHSLDSVIEDQRIKIVKGDISDPNLVSDLIPGTDVVVNFAAESHVDNSIRDVGPFIKSNIIGTVNLLQQSYKNRVSKFLQISTDEVYGSITEGSFTEISLTCPRNPYSASKSSAENFCFSFANTFGMDITITRTCNNYGPFQQSEKFIPTAIRSLIEGKKIPLYGAGLQEREWIHVSDNCRAIERIIWNGRPNEIYNIGSRYHLQNIQLANMLCEISGNSDCIEFVQDRPGHDFRYSIDSSKLRINLGWEPEVPFDQGIQETYDWYKSMLGDAN